MNSAAEDFKYIAFKMFSAGYKAANAGNKDLDTAYNEYFEKTLKSIVNQVCRN